MTLILLEEFFAVCTCARDSGVPSWCLSSGDHFLSISITPDECSVVCVESSVPEGVDYEAGLRALKIDGPLEFSLVGILSSICTPLAEEGIAVFVQSTYNTDFIFVKDDKCEHACSILETAGFMVNKQNSSAA